MGIVKSNPRSILIAWSAIIVVGFGTFVFAKDIVSTERRTEEIRRIKRERRMHAYGSYNKNHDDDGEKQQQKQQD
ncbi:hypothetical protein BX661DRAFT_184498 [Kickxella alabastrina]|uniref:Uncharacterized protein n=1 Tax=Kickxella alabastrina TaxID=61397 RepID=A0ACC1IQG8_9FUNG|nr:uncharacterized protein BX661DRAFT_184498 [Kickxella alabastrina]KAI7825415.1 hypothetical protein BX661DRAFT_184498 [Kickxella alabastrina]KAJ1898970.1 hypothetical protein LPJ66_002414 [Kickxella alabastrina]KAJ1939582.1 hypothetical protein GGF37_004340 [Kickxella alabastrina]